MNRRNRKKAITFDCLDERILLTRNYPIGFIGPVELGSKFYTPPAYGDADPTDPMEDPAGNPIVSYGSLDNDSIGGYMQVDVSDNDSIWNLKKVVYTISAPQVDDQIWTLNESSHTTTSGATHTWDGSPDEPYPEGDDFEFYWSKDPGTYTITVEVTYNNPASTVRIQSQTFTTSAPHVTGITVSGQGQTFGRIGTEQKIGFSSGPNSLPMGVQFNAELDYVPTFGYFSFVQTVDISDKIVGQLKDSNGNWSTLTNTMAFPYGLQAVDDGGTGTPEIYNYKVPTTTTGYGYLHVGDENLVGDSPSFVSKVDVNNFIPTRIESTKVFTTYLVWNPGSGIHIGVAKVNWTESGTAVYNGALTGPTVGTEIYDTSKWTITNNHTSPWVETGSASRDYVEWTTTAQKASDYYLVIS